jgi:ribonuclease Z
LHEGKLLSGSNYLSYPNKARRIVVGGDNDRPALLSDACKDAQVLIHEATYTLEVAEKVGPGVQHSSAAIVAAFAEAAGLPNLVLTHFSPRYQADTAQSPSIADIQAEAEQGYRGNLFLAEDFARYRLSRSGQFSRI